ncbi:MAG: alcohol acetyltransferase [Eubacteriales bacterium]|nr:alcohol acetyltransferase [Clostridiales bacterium]MDY3071436.1 alcohol acetyltransferase [Eubacteriales bacterium]
MPDAAPRFMRLDNAAKIYPAARRRNWMALFRVSAELCEPVDVRILERAQARTLARFPSFALRLKKGLFWYYLEHNEGAPEITEDVANPCVRLDPKTNRGFMFRVRYYRCRIALEVYHVLADGTGGMCFLKTLVAEYLTLKYGVKIPRDREILDCDEAPRPDETEDAYLKYAGDITRSRAEADAYYVRGTDTGDRVCIITGMLPVQDVLARARSRGATLTEYLTAALILSINDLQTRTGLPRRRRKPVKINVPINLRRFYPSHTMRNFALYVNPGIDPRLGEYTFDEILRAVHHHMGTEVDEKLLNARIATNVRTEQNRLLRAAPLFLKNAVMKLSFHLVGDRKTSSSISNLGVVRVPPEMEAYIRRFDFILGPLSRNRVVCAALSYRDTLYLNFTRTIRETDVERGFFRFLVRDGLHVRLESNRLS